MTIVLQWVSNRLAMDKQWMGYKTYTNEVYEGVRIK